MNRNSGRIRFRILLAIVSLVTTASVFAASYTVSQRVRQFGNEVDGRLGPAFRKAGLTYPPKELAYVAFKDSRRMEVYGRMSRSEPWRYVMEYPILATSGRLGPKLRQGDYQVPEGIYRITFLNANSRFHLSLRLDYPNEYDKRMAAQDGRSKLGGDIMIHGNAVSIGCLAMGDDAAEDLFVLTARVSRENVRVIISPTDFRDRQPTGLPQQPSWTQTLYHSLRDELRQFKRTN